MTSCKACKANGQTKVVSQPQGSVNLCDDCYDLYSDVIAGGLKKNELIVLYQPKVSVEKRAITAVEALVRWEHPTRGLLTPDKFLYGLFALGLSYDLFNIVHSKAIRDVIDWYEDGERLDVSINVNVEDLTDSRFQDVAIKSNELGERTGRAVTFEVTETQDDWDRELAGISKNLQKYRYVGLSIDDYGVGHSSLQRLLNMECHELKLDRDFIAKLPSCTKHQKAIRHLIALATELKVNVVAEGVETALQAALLISLKCNFLQGYYYGRPMEAHHILQHVREFQFSKPAVFKAVS